MIRRTHQTQRNLPRFAFSPLGRVALARPTEPAVPTPSTGRPGILPHVSLRDVAARLTERLRGLVSRKDPLPEELHFAHWTGAKTAFVQLSAAALIERTERSLGTSPRAARLETVAKFLRHQNIESDSSPRALTERGYLKPAAGGEPLLNLAAIPHDLEGVVLVAIASYDHMLEALAAWRTTPRSEAQRFQEHYRELRHRLENADLLFSHLFSEFVGLGRFKAETPDQLTEAPKLSEREQDALAEKVKTLNPLERLLLAKCLRATTLNQIFSQAEVGVVAHNWLLCLQTMEPGLAQALFKEEVVPHHVFPAGLFEQYALRASAPHPTVSERSRAARARRERLTDADRVQFLRSMRGKDAEDLDLTYLSPSGAVPEAAESFARLGAETLDRLGAQAFLLHIGTNPNPTTFRVCLGRIMNAESVHFYTSALGRGLDQHPAVNLPITHGAPPLWGEVETHHAGKAICYMPKRILDPAGKPIGNSREWFVRGTEEIDRLSYPLNGGQPNGQRAFFVNPSFVSSATEQTGSVRLPEGAERSTLRRKHQMETLGILADHLAALERMGGWAAASLLGRAFKSTGKIFLFPLRKDSELTRFLLSQARAQGPAAQNRALGIYYQIMKDCPAYALAPLAVEEVHGGYRLDATMIERLIELSDRFRAKQTQLVTAAAQTREMSEAVQGPGATLDIFLQLEWTPLMQAVSEVFPGSSRPAFFDLNPSHLLEVQAIGIFRDTFVDLQGYEPSAATGVARYLELRGKRGVLEIAAQHALEQGWMVLQDGKLQTTPTGMDVARRSTPLSRAQLCGARLKALSPGEILTWNRGEDEFLDEPRVLSEEQLLNEPIGACLRLVKPATEDGMLRLSRYLAVNTSHIEMPEDASFVMVVTPEHGFLIPTERFERAVVCSATDSLVVPFSMDLLRGRETLEHMAQADRPLKLLQPGVRGGLLLQGEFDRQARNNFALLADLLKSKLGRFPFPCLMQVRIEEDQPLQPLVYADGRTLVFSKSSGILEELNEHSAGLQRLATLARAAVSNEDADLSRGYSANNHLGNQIFAIAGPAELIAACRNHLANESGDPQLVLDLLEAYSQRPDREFQALRRAARQRLRQKDLVHLIDEEMLAGVRDFSASLVARNGKGKASREELAIQALLERRRTNGSFEDLVHAAMASPGRAVQLQGAKHRVESLDAAKIYPRGTTIEEGNYALLTTAFSVSDPLVRLMKLERRLFTGSEHARVLWVYRHGIVRAFDPETGEKLYRKDEQLTLEDEIERLETTHHIPVRAELQNMEPPMAHAHLAWFQKILEPPMGVVARALQQHNQGRKIENPDDEIALRKALFRVCLLYCHPEWTLADTKLPPSDATEEKNREQSFEELLDLLRGTVLREVSPQLQADYHNTLLSAWLTSEAGLALRRKTSVGDLSLALAEQLEGLEAQALEVVGRAIDAGRYEVDGKIVERFHGLDAVRASRVVGFYARVMEVGDADSRQSPELMEIERKPVAVVTAAAATAAAPTPVAAPPAPPAPTPKPAPAASATPSTPTPPPAPPKPAAPTESSPSPREPARPAQSAPPSQPLRAPSSPPPATSKPSPPVSLPASAPLPAAPPRPTVVVATSAAAIAAALRAPAPTSSPAPRPVVQTVAMRVEALYRREDPDAQPRVARTTYSYREGHNEWAKRVRDNFGYRCCLTGANEPRMLRAAHILNWAEFPAARFKRSNGLLLYAELEMLFDLGYWTLGEQFNVIVTPRARQLSELLRSHLGDIDGRPIRQPRYRDINPDFLAWHRERVFDTFELYRGF